MGNNIAPKYQKDYKNATFQNPRAAMEQQVSAARWKKAKSVAILVVFLGIIYTVFYSPLFMITDVSVNGLQRISRTKLMSVIDDYRNDWFVWIIPQNNILFFNEKKLQEKIGTNYLLENMTITKEFPRTISISVTEKQAQIAWLTDAGCFQLDDTGLVIAACDATTQDLIRIRDDQPPAQQVSVGSPVSTREEIEYLMLAKTRLSEQLHPKIFHVHADGATAVRVEGDEHFSIILNITLSVDDQVNRLYIMLSNEEIRNRFDSIDYFDLRYGDKIYYQ